MDNETAGSPAEPGKEADRRIPWLLATADDLSSVDFEAPIRGSVAADAGELSQLFGQAAHAATGPADLFTAERRVFVMLASLTGMHFKPHDRNEPYAPFASLSDGQRTAIPSDFRGPILDSLAELAERTSNLVLKARLADVCWLLERRRSSLGRVAITSYIKIVQQVDSGQLEFSFDQKRGGLHHSALALLRRALRIAWTLGRDKLEAREAADLAVSLRKRSIAAREIIEARWTTELDLEFGASPPGEVARDLEGLLRVLSPSNPDLLAGLWRLVAEGYRIAGEDLERQRCQSEAAESIILAAKDAQRRQQSALLVAHKLSSAIAQLHGLSGMKERRKQLQHDLIEIQADIPEQLSPFSHEMDLSDLVGKVDERLEGIGLREKLFVFANVTRSPEVENLRREARENIQQFPLSSIFGVAHLDREGKFIHRSDGSDPKSRSDEDESAIKRQVAQSESIRRTVACALIDNARAKIFEQHFIADDVFTTLLNASPFVPNHLLATFARGFTRFFEGDYVSAIYILTPLLENSLRHVLKQHDFDVTSFDDTTQTQEDRTISSLFEQMRRELDSVFTDAITADIENVFLLKPGPHLRHTLSHGLFHDTTPYGDDAIYASFCDLVNFPTVLDATIPSLARNIFSVRIIIRGSPYTSKSRANRAFFWM